MMWPSHLTALLLLWMVLGSVLVSVFAVKRRERVVDGIARIQLAGLLVGAAAATATGAGGALRYVLPAGRIAWALTAWAGLFTALSAMLMLCALSAVKPAKRGPVFTAGLSWTASALLFFLAGASPLAMFLAWGILAAGAYMMVVAGTRAQTTLEAGWTMLAMNEAGAVALLLGAIAGTVGSGGTGWGSVLAALGVVGLGAKAGLFPFQLWLPVAEPEAPAPAAGLLSGVLTSVVLVGLWQWLRWFPAPMWLGWGLVVFGLGGGLLGMVHAVIERDHKRVLAYSTVEWVGMALTALGLSIVEHGLGNLTAATLAQAAFFAVLLMHMGAKAALFAVSGWVERATGTRDLNRLGGLWPSSGALGRWALLAAVTLMALPPTGGYLGEWSVLESVFMGSAGRAGAALMVTAMALALLAAGGATALLRWFGILFLGPERRQARERPTAGEVWMVGVGAGMAVAVGPGAGFWLPWMLSHAPEPAGFARVPLIAPTFTHPAQESLLVSLGGRIFYGLPGTPGVVVFPGPGFTATSPWDLMWLGGALVALIYFAVRWWRRRLGWAVRHSTPWNGSMPYRPGYAWTATGVTHPLRLAFAPVVRLERRRFHHPTRGLRVETDTVDVLIHRIFRPGLDVLRGVSARLARVQSGYLPHYLGYLLGATLAGLAVLRLTGSL